MFRTVMTSKLSLTMGTVAVWRCFGQFAGAHGRRARGFRLKRKRIKIRPSVGTVAPWLVGRISATAPVINLALLEGLHLRGIPSSRWLFHRSSDYFVTR